MNEDKLDPGQKHILSLLKKHSPKWVCFLSAASVKTVENDEDLESLLRYYVKYDDEAECLVMHTPDEGRNRQVLIHDIRQITQWFVQYFPPRKKKEDK